MDLVTRVHSRIQCHTVAPCLPPPYTHTHNSTQGTEDIPLRDRNLVVLVTNSNYKHDLVDGEYRERRESCESAAAKLGKEFLRDVTIEELEGTSSLYSLRCH